MPHRSLEAVQVTHHSPTPPPAQLSAGPLPPATGARGRDRQRIADAIHDDVLQTLDALSLTLSRQAQSADSEVSRAALERADTAIRGSARALRRHLTVLADDEDTNFDLVAALRACGDEAVAPYRTTFRVLGAADRAGPRARSTAFEVAREAIRNAARHARARAITVTVRPDDAGLIVDVVDDGCGLSPTSEGRSGHVGLKMMRRRLHAIGGSLVIAPGSGGAGTRVRLLIPDSDAR